MRTTKTDGMIRRVDGIPGHWGQNYTNVRVMKTGAVAVVVAGKPTGSEVYSRSANSLLLDIRVF